MFRILAVLAVLVIGAPAAAQTMTGADIRAAKEALAEQGYEPGPADGVWGAGSAAALREYQSDWQLDPTGALTPDLLSRLMREHPATRPQWFADTISRCEVWNPLPGARVTITWTGPCVGGRANGTGRLTWNYRHRDEPVEAAYEGDLRNGKAHGRGVYTLPGGSRYEGEFRDSEPNGRGVWTSANGNRYEGGIRDGKRHGRGVMTWLGGDRYEGEWRDGEAHGRGVAIWADGRRYEGEWREGKPHGRGVYSWPDGYRYVGELLAGLPHGSGTYTTGDGETYSGIWTNGCFREGDRKAGLGATEEECGSR